jgi:hypothetical protein
MGLDMSHGCWHGGYGSFHYFRKMLMRIAGYPSLELMEGFYGYGDGASDGLRDPLCLVQFAVDAKEGMARDVLQEVRRDLPIRWDALRPNPMFALIYHSDCGGSIPWWECGEIAGSLSALRDRAVAYRDDTRWSGEFFVQHLDDMVCGLIAAWVACEDVEFC